jgi:lysophospholipase L1-like esterase
MKKHMSFKNNQWVTWWSRAQRGLRLLSQKCPQHHTVYLKEMPKSQKIRLRFAAFYDTQSITIQNVYCYEKGKSKKYPITFKNQQTYQLTPQSSIWSDALDLNYINQSHLVIEYDILSDEGYTCASGFELKDYDVFVASANQIYGLCSLELLGSSLKGCLCAFGDSIVEQGHYTRILQEKALTKGYSFIQLGLSGNRLLRQLEAVDLYGRNYTNITIDKQCFGIAGIERFQREVLECHQIKQIMIAIGINDLYQPGTFCAQTSELPEIEEMKKGYLLLKNMISDIPALWCGITPFIGNSDWTLPKEKIRLQINEWIEYAFINSINFDDLLLDDQNQYIQENHIGDYLHPSAIGGNKMAKEMSQCLNI